MSIKTRSQAHNHGEDGSGQGRPINRLVLSFDGTGNSFQGTSEDTNIVKLVDMFSRRDDHQYHYYQPGIGTYTAGGSVNLPLFGRIKRWFSQTLDTAIATSFDSHVMSGYRFLMNHYYPGDHIYIFGFSRGAFTARFLARMISHVGLLSMGNEEMVPFAYKVYQDYEQGKDVTGSYAKAFQSTFCQLEQEPDKHENVPPQGIKVHFLGLFDTVNSVGTFDLPFSGKMGVPVVTGTAHHIRHAVAIDERRVKFKAALLQQDVNYSKGEDVKEVWFPGNHGDIGGGWPAPSTQKDSIKGKIIDQGAAHLDKSQDAFQLSDIALKWMVDELDKVELQTDRPSDRLAWNQQHKLDFLARFAKHRTQAVASRIHDTLSFNGGGSKGKAIMWKLMEYFPFIRRWEFFDRTWHNVYFPPNMGACRDVPPGTHFHHSVLERLRLENKPVYRPGNQVSNANAEAKENFGTLARLALANEDGSVSGSSKAHQNKGRDFGARFEVVEEKDVGLLAREEEGGVNRETELDRVYELNWG